MGAPPAAPAVGDILFAAPPRISGSPTGFAYSWLACDANGQNCSAANGSPTNTSRYQIVSGDTGSTIRAQVTASYSGHPDSVVKSAPTGVVGGATFPLAASGTGLYLVTAGGSPFLMIADSPQGMIVNLSPTVQDGGATDAHLYLSTRQSQGFNTVWTNILANDYTGGRGKDGTQGTLTANYGATFDSINPFTSTLGGGQYDLTTPNTSYWSRADALIDLATSYGFWVWIDPIETGGWLNTIVANGSGTSSKSYAYGQFLGTRYGGYNNIVWFNGNDYSSAGDSTDDPCVLAVAQGIANKAPSHLQTIEFFNPDPSGSLNYDISNDPTQWAALINLDGAYTYGPTYDQVLKEYGRSTIPVYLVEGNYEGEHNGGSTVGGTVQYVRGQWYQTILSGGALGGLFGNHYCSMFADSTWPSHVSDTAATQAQYVTALFKTREWYKITPDTHTTRTLVTSGFGTYTTGAASGYDWIAAGKTSDGKYGFAYVPGYNNAGTAITTGVTFTVALSALSSGGTSAAARWYDPTNGTFGSPISGSPFATSGTHNFTSPGANNAGEGDWVLVLEVS